MRLARRRRAGLRNCVLPLAAALAVSAAAHAQNNDWPCKQKLVPVLDAGTYWPGGVPQNTGWRDDEKLFALVPAIVDRDTPDAEAMAKLNQYLDTIPKPQLGTALPKLFSAITDETNDERTRLIQRIQQLGTRQRRLSDVVAKISTDADHATPGSSQAADLAGERDFDIRAFQDTQRTMRYACEAPAGMEDRLGEFAKALRARLN